MWTTLARADDIRNLEASVADNRELPHGTKVRFVMSLNTPIGKLFSLPGAEYLFRPAMPPGIDLVDVYGQDSRTVVVEGVVASPLFVLAAAGFIARHWVGLSLLTIGVLWGLAAIVYLIKFDGELMPIGDMLKWVVVGIGGILVLRVLSIARPIGGKR